MSDIISDGYTRVSWVSSISNTAAPTTTELNAGVALESYITADGYENGVTTAKVDTTALNSTQNTAAAGRREPRAAAGAALRHARGRPRRRRPRQDGLPR